MRRGPSLSIVLGLSNLPSRNLTHNFRLLLIELFLSHHVFAIRFTLQNRGKRIATLAFVQLLFASLLVASTDAGESPKDNNGGSQK